jgi:hypothetical protein
VCARLGRSRVHSIYRVHVHAAPQIEAERAYVDAVRGDLGYRPTSHLPFTVFEDYIEFDDARSGVDEAEWAPATDA